MNVYIKTMTEDDDKEVVAQACTSIADIIKDYGYGTVEPCMYEFYSFLCDIVSLGFQRRIKL